MLNIERLKELKSWISDLRKFGVSEGSGDVDRQQESED